MFKQIYVCPPKRTGQRYRFFLKRSVHRLNLGIVAADKFTDYLCLKNTDNYFVSSMIRKNRTCGNSVRKMFLSFNRAPQKPHFLKKENDPRHGRSQVVQKLHHIDRIRIVRKCRPLRSAERNPTAVVNTVGNHALQLRIVFPKPSCDLGWIVVFDQETSLKACGNSGWRINSANPESENGSPHISRRALR